MTTEITDLDDAVRLALQASYGNRIDAAWHADEDGRFRPTINAEAFELALAEIERRGWVYEHASFITAGERENTFWIGELDPDPEIGVNRTLSEDEGDTYPTRMLAGCIAFVKAVANALPDQEEQTA